MLEEASVDIPERAVASLDMAAKQAALWLDTAAAVLPAGTAEAGAGPAPPAQVAAQPDMAARVEKLAQWAEARGTAERVVPAAAEPQGTGALAVRPVQRGVVGLGSARMTIRRWRKRLNALRTSIPLWDLALKTASRR